MVLYRVLFMIAETEPCTHCFWLSLFRFVLFSWRFFFFFFLFLFHFQSWMSCSLFSSLLPNSIFQLTMINYVEMKEKKNWTWKLRNQTIWKLTEIFHFDVLFRFCIPFRFYLVSVFEMRHYLIHIHNKIRRKCVLWKCSLLQVYFENGLVFFFHSLFSTFCCLWQNVYNLKKKKQIVVSIRFCIIVCTTHTVYGIQMNDETQTKKKIISIFFRFCVFSFHWICWFGGLFVFRFAQFFFSFLPFLSKFYQFSINNELTLLPHYVYKNHRETAPTEKRNWIQKY